ncbi:MAG: hypothetical protein J6Y20_05705 [Lachnospiraceae bacterium]|nr:hypothetical protein [Lachnospiraceae bacterium]
MKNMRIKYRLLFVATILAFMITGCGKETPVSATSETPTNEVTNVSMTETPVVTITEDPAPVATVTEEPIVTPTDVPTPTIIHVSMSDVVVFETPISETDKTFFQGLYEKHIEPFLNGYEVQEISIRDTGAKRYGYNIYEVLYICQKGSVRLSMHSFISAMEYEDVVADDVFFDRIVMIENQEIIAEYENALGLSNYINK